MNSPLVSINILSYNDKNTIKQCIDSAVEQNYPNIEINIIVNNSPDSSAQVIEQNLAIWQKYLDKTGKKINYILNRENNGFAGGHNQAIGLSQGDFILCLNSDAILSPDFTEKAVKEIITDQQIGAVQGKIISYDFSSNSPRCHPEKNLPIIDTVGLTMLKNRRIIATGQGEADAGQFDKKEEIFGPDGAAPLYRKKALDDVKYKNEYFDESFFAYKEDVDLAWRLRLFGWKTVYLPEAKVFHSRTSGDSAATNYAGIIRERLKINKFSKYHSFKNQRLMQLKNEQPLLLFKHFPRWFSKEILAWLYMMVFERFTFKLIQNLFKQIPSALEKRRFIMKNKKVSAKEMEKWFK